MSILKQLVCVISMNARAIRRKPSSALVVVVSIAGVVAVLISVLSLTAGLLRSQQKSINPDRLVIVAAGATNEASSAILRSAADVILSAPGIRRDSEGRPAASAELVGIVGLQDDRDGSEASVLIRGVGEGAAALRPEIRIESGRMFTPGTSEIVVGKAAAAQYRNLQVGDQPDLKGSRWKVVGVFSANGGALESALMGDAATLMSAYRSDQYQSIGVLLDSPQARDPFERFVVGQGLPVEIFTEAEYLRSQSANLSGMLKIVAFFVGGIMAFGAIFAALNIMYSAVNARRREIATLRAIGYGSPAMIIAVLLETLVLALCGGLLGGLAAWLFFDGYDVSTVAGSGGKLVFELAVTPAVVALGILWACSIGLLGGLPPALRAARMPVATALR